MSARIHDSVYTPLVELTINAITSQSQNAFFFLCYVCGILFLSSNFGMADLRNGLEDFPDYIVDTKIKFFFWSED